MKKVITILSFFVLVAVGAVGYFAYDNYLLKGKNSALENKISQVEQTLSNTTQKLDSTIAGLNNDIKNLNSEIDTTQEQLATTTAALSDSQQQYLQEKNRIDAFTSQINDIKGQVGTLKKLSETDPELLKKYSKVYFLNENYKPADLYKIDTEFTFNQNEEYDIYTGIWPFLKILMQTARADGVDLEIISAYRSFGQQSSLKSSYKVVYGTGANKFSADQGYSEHQLGTAVDFTTETVGSSFEGFEKTKSYQWLLDNAYTFGFAISYPQTNSFYQFEPWHWRFVGRALALKLHDEGKHFYDLDQREIDKYLVSFFD